MRRGLGHEVYVFDVRDVLLLGHGQSNCPRSSLAITAITFAAFDFGLGVLAAVCRQRASNLILRFGELALLAANVPLVALMRLDLSARHG
jgi:hypothetical protein